MKRILALLLCVMMVLSLSACKNKEGDLFPEESDEYTTVYAFDKLINRFFTEYAAKYGETFYDVHRHPQYLDSFVAYIGQCALTVRNASDTHGGLIISLEGGSTTDSRDEMLSIFAKVAQSVDASCSADAAKQAVAHLKEQTSTVQEYRVSPYVRVLHYTPLVEEMGINCRLELVVGNYYVAEE